MIYVYVCDNCKQELEIIQQMKDASLTECPLCHSQEFRRKLFSPTVFVKNGVQTLGELAEHNAKHLPDEELKKIEDQKNDLERHTPWFNKPKWRKPEVTDKKLNSMTPEQTHKYIETGII